jgi:hypothetical protein
MHVGGPSILGVSKHSLENKENHHGMGFSLSGLIVVANWPSPVTGSYSLKVVVVDSAGLSATATIPVTITAK